MKNIQSLKGETADFKTSRLQKTSTDFSHGDFIFSQDFKRLLKTSEDFMGLQMTSQDFIRLRMTSWDFKRLPKTSLDFTDFMRLHGFHETSETL